MESKENPSSSFIGENLPNVFPMKIDLGELFLFVKSLGGYKTVTRRKDWDKVASFLGYSGSLRLKKIGSYLKHLYFRELYVAELREQKAEREERVKEAKDDGTGTTSGTLSGSGSVYRVGSMGGRVIGGEDTLEEVRQSYSLAGGVDSVKVKRSYGSGESVDKMVLEPPDKSKPVFVGGRMRLRRSIESVEEMMKRITVVLEPMNGKYREPCVSIGHRWRGLYDLWLLTTQDVQPQSDVLNALLKLTPLVVDFSHETLKLYWEHHGSNRRSTRIVDGVMSSSTKGSSETRFFDRKLSNLLHVFDTIDDGDILRFPRRGKDTIGSSRGCSVSGQSGTAPSKDSLQIGITEEQKESVKKSGEEGKESGKCEMERGDSEQDSDDGQREVDSDSENESEQEKEKEKEKENGKDDDFEGCCEQKDWDILERETYLCTCILMELFEMKPWMQALVHGTWDESSRFSRADRERFRNSVFSLFHIITKVVSCETIDGEIRMNCLKCLSRQLHYDCASPFAFEVFVSSVESFLTFSVQNHNGSWMECAPVVGLSLEERRLEEDPKTKNAAPTQKQMIMAKDGGDISEFLLLLQKDGIECMRNVFESDVVLKILVEVHGDRLTRWVSLIRILMRSFFISREPESLNHCVSCLHHLSQLNVEFCCETILESFQPRFHIHRCSDGLKEQGEEEEGEDEDKDKEVREDENISNPIASKLSRISDENGSSSSDAYSSVHALMDPDAIDAMMWASSFEEDDNGDLIHILMTLLSHHDTLFDASMDVIDFSDIKELRDKEKSFRTLEDDIQRGLARKNKMTRLRAKKRDLLRVSAELDHKHAMSTGISMETRRNIAKLLAMLSKAREFRTALRKYEYVIAMLAIQAEYFVSVHMSFILANLNR
eukprot:TRINITY_DN1171_c1_g1_i1.p1 TRINITY_DN1171_c1_g1~~TRINITY_DN1171_c1_g1_i1.p1  ORF type:complete len:887 (-),score=289.95 TRINITY_DN1171_c1_g1_i1:44-2704(-)